MDNVKTVYPTTNKVYVGYNKSINTVCGGKSTDFEHFNYYVQRQLSASCKHNENFNMTERLSYT